MYNNNKPKMFIDPEDKEALEMFSYLCETNPDKEPYMLELMVWAYKYKHEEYEAIMEKYRGSDSFINLDAFKGEHVQNHIAEDPDHQPSRFGDLDAEVNAYIRKIAIGEEIQNPDFDTIMSIVS